MVEAPLCSELPEETETLFDPCLDSAPHRHRHHLGLWEAGEVEEAVVAVASRLAVGREEEVEGAL
jgi:hypothetical protein